ncbi:uncharacterized protein STEHIDRAFT_167151 [Stereum hirsutum FP-91666 SS1]|uniref:uncharacterized protein n=1 Tax=Stereum hirsutum (strain FP-91666) TaxID=721885 RepID=UPI000440D72B|nr:uncharacterized protein STEHIDRAFT_167151 [Stereum hirsutum FP-91666 SS1]EIM89314.1 hypothetical protein STEHIDRAFT_167151 [Stereum hirsutum FP-91666 SS1]
MSRPSFFGPLIKSLHIDQSCLCWMKLTPFFQVMTNLRCLRLESRYRLDISNLSTTAFSSVPPSASLVDFETTYTFSAREVFTFLRSHPKLSSLRLGVVTCTDSDDDEPQSSLISMTPPPLLRVLELNIQDYGLSFATKVLRLSGSHLDDLSIQYSNHDMGELESHPSVLAHFDALSACYDTLTQLSIENTPHKCDQPFSWIIANILPRTSNLRVLELRQPFSIDRFGSNNVEQVICIESFLPLISNFPKTLETLKWIGGDACSPSMGSGLSVLGASNAKALFKLFPSLKVVEYNERGYIFIFRRLADGVIKRRTMRGVERRI